MAAGTKKNRQKKNHPLDVDLVVRGNRPSVRNFVPAPQPLLRLGLQRSRNCGDGCGFSCRGMAVCPVGASGLSWVFGWNLLNAEESIKEEKITDAFLCKEKRNADGFHRRFLLLGLHFLAEGVDISFEQMGGGASRFFHLLLDGGGEGLVPKIHPFWVELPAKTGFDGEVGIELFGKTFDEIAGHIFWQGAAEIEMDGFLQQGLFVLFAKAAHLFGYFPHVNIAAQNDGVVFGEIDGGIHRC